MSETLIAIITCKKYAYRVQMQLDTWVPQAIAAGFDVEVFDGERLGVPDDYLSLPLKTKALCKWAADRGYKRLLKLDDDAYIRVANFHTVFDDYAGIFILKNDCGLRNKDIKDFPNGTCPFPYASGGGYWLSERSMKILIDAPFYSDWAEDRWVGQTLGRAGIFVTVLPNYYMFIPWANAAHPLDYKNTKEYTHIPIQQVIASEDLILLTQITKAEEFKALHAWQPKEQVAAGSPPTLNSTALIVIATGVVYQHYAKELIASAKQFFVPHDVFLFTDSQEPFDGVSVQLHHAHLGYPGSTLMRYHAIVSQREALSNYDYIFYVDADMKFLSTVSAGEVFSAGITATEHPGFIGGGGSPETRPKSAAYVRELKVYYCGGFNGGTAKAFLAMAEELKRGVDTDKANGITAVWHDESHLNRFLFYNPPSRVLSVEFCWPSVEWRLTSYLKEWRKVRGETYGQELVPKLMAIDKSSRTEYSSISPQPPPPTPPPNVIAARCNRHNVSACSVCIAHGWQFRQPITPAPTPISPQATTPPAPPPQPNPQVQAAAAKALTATLKPSQGALYRNRNADNQRKLR